MLKGFKDFLLRGNIVDLAVAVVIGTAFAKVVDTIVSNIINPLLAAIVSGPSLGFGPTLRAGRADTFMNFGDIISQLIVFVLTAAVVYFVVIIPMNKIMSMRKKPDEEAPAALESNEVVLLTEIRDALRAQAGQAPGHQP